MDKKSLADRLKKALMELQGETKPRFRLSQLRTCPRAQWFSVNEPTEAADLDLTTLGHFLKGRLFERWVRERVVPECVSEKEVSLNGVTGHIDAFVPPDTVIEIKATTTESLSFVPHLNHIWQVKAYLAALRYEGVDDPKGLLVYIPTDNPALAIEHIYEVTLTDDDYNFLLKQTELVLGDEPPPVPPNYDGNSLPCVGVLYGRAVRCPYYDRCFSETETAIVPKTWVDLIGAQLQVIKAQQEAIKQHEQIKSQIEQKIKDFMKARHDIWTIQIEGSAYVLVAKKTVRKTVDIKALEEDLGKDFVDKYRKETPVVMINITRKE